MAIQQQKIEYIIKGTMTKLSRPDYFACASKDDMWNMIRFLRDDWFRIEWKPIIKRDVELEGILKRCSLGSKLERENLQAYYNAQNINAERIVA